MTHCTFQFFMGGLGDFTVANFSLLVIQSKGTALRMRARNGELFFCRSLSLATRQHPPLPPRAPTRGAGRLRRRNLRVWSVRF